MQITDLLEARKSQWRELEQLCERLERVRGEHQTAQEAARFAALYRAVCADLALAESYRMPPETVHFLNLLVGRAHNQLYRSQTFDPSSWGRVLFVDLPKKLFRDRCMVLAFCIFWGVFLLCAALAHFSTDFAEEMVGREQLDAMENMYDRPFGEMDPNQRSAMVGFYIYNNAGIGLQCFALGLAFGIGGVFITTYNAAALGTVFGYMSTTEQSDTFFNFVTAHGPFELTAIVISAAAGMRFGFALINTNGKTRLRSLQDAMPDALPVVLLGTGMFLIAALIEAFISPSPIPYEYKAGVAIFSTILLLSYYFGLGFFANLSEYLGTDQSMHSSRPLSAEDDAQRDRDSGRYPTLADADSGSSMPDGNIADGNVASREAGQS